MTEKEIEIMLCKTCDGCWYTCPYVQKYNRTGKCKKYTKEKKK